MPKSTDTYSKLYCGQNVYDMMATKETLLEELGTMVHGIVEEESRLSASSLHRKVKRDFRVFGARLVSKELCNDKTFLGSCEQGYFLSRLHIATKEKLTQLYNTVMINVKLRFNASAIEQFKNVTNKKTRIVVESANVDYQRATIVTDLGRRWKATFFHIDFYNQVQAQLAMRIQKQINISSSLEPIPARSLLDDTTSGSFSSNAATSSSAMEQQCLHERTAVQSEPPFQNTASTSSDPLCIASLNVSSSAVNKTSAAAQQKLPGSTSTSIDWRQNLVNPDISEDECVKEMYLYYVVPQPGIVAALLKLQDQVEVLKAQLSGDSSAGELVAALSETMDDLAGFMIKDILNCLLIITVNDRSHVQQMGLLYRES